MTINRGSTTMLRVYHTCILQYPLPLSFGHSIPYLLYLYVLPQQQQQHHQQQQQELSVGFGCPTR